jgi:hypothetical protein
MRVRLACVAMQFAEGGGCCRRMFVLVAIRSLGRCAESLKLFILSVWERSAPEQVDF